LTLQSFEALLKPIAMYSEGKGRYGIKSVQSEVKIAVTQSRMRDIL
jgi:hypothetical protein